MKLGLSEKDTQRILIISIFVVAYLLFSANQILGYRYLQLEGNCEVNYTTSIPQVTNFTATRENFPSTNSAIIANISPRYESSNFYLPRFDYDQVFFNLTLESKEAQSEVEFSIRAGIFQIASVTQTISDKTTVTLQSDFEEVKNSTYPTWLVEIWASISPFEDFICHDLVIWVYSDIPLCPVVMDIQSTNGKSLYENYWMPEMYSTYPVVHAMKDNVSSSLCYVYPRSVNHTLYLRPGSINGSCFWRGIYYNAVEFNVTFNVDEKVYLIFRLKAVEVEFSFDTSYPVQHLYWDVGQYDQVYQFYFTPDTCPTTLFVPPDNAHVSFAIVDTMNIQHSNRDPVAFVLINDDIAISGSTNVQVRIMFEPGLGFHFINSAIIDLLTLSLFFLIILQLRMLISGKQIFPKNRSRVDLRILPLFIFMVIAFIPWFPFDHIYYTDFSETLSVHNLPIGTLPIVARWTTGSSIILRVPEYALVWSFWSIVLYWLPLIWSSSQIRKPRNLETDRRIGLALFSPAIFFILANPLTLNIESLFVLLIPLTWLIAFGIVTTRGYYQNTEKAEEQIQETELSKRVDIEKSYQFHEPIWNLLIPGHRFAICALVAFTIPCVLGYYYDYNSLYPSIIPIVPLLSLLNLGSSYLIHNNLQTLSALIVGIPYAIFTSFTLLWLWEYTENKRSIIWILTGSLISMLSMIPGLLIMNVLGMIRSGYIWYRWTPFPILHLFVLAVIVAHTIDGISNKTSNTRKLASEV